MGHVVLSLTIICFLLASCAPEQLATEPDLPEASFLRDVFDQNGLLRAENQQLREMLLSYESIITKQNETLGKYFDRLRAEGTAPWEFAHPYARISAENITVNGSQVIIRVSGAFPAMIADTNSMDPTLDSSSKVIVVKPMGERDIHVGDIIGYHCSNCKEDEIVLHRVATISSDDEGTFFVLKGDNNLKQDPEKVRFSQIETVVVGIIY